MTVRTLRPGERVPDFAPRRYPDRDGGIRLRWRVAENELVEARENRVQDGLVVDRPYVRRKVSMADRLWDKVDQSDGPDACWPWTGALSSGYGAIHRGERGRAMSASRAAWIVTNGSIPPGLFVCHRCDNPPCCNPAHLFLGTPGDNARDMVAKGRINPGRSLTFEQAAELRAKRAAGATLADLAAEYGIHISTVCGIAKGRSTVAK